MKIIINASTVRVGGGLQATHSFIDECRGITGFTFHVFLSARLREMIDRSMFPHNFVFYDIAADASSFRRRLELRKELSSLEAAIAPDAVFTIFGPPYWRPRALHICGFAKGQYIYKNSPFFRMLSFRQSVMLKLKEYYHVKSFREDCDILVVETDDVRGRLMRRLPGKPVYTVSNTCHQLFDDSSQWCHDIVLPASDAFTLLTISASYIHKNLQVIPPVIDYLVKRYPGFKFRFVLTINKEQLQGITPLHEKHIIFLGKVDLYACPSLYQQADAMFLPTLLECFSASYVEAMKMDRMILTSKLPFALHICGEAALYFDPMSPVNIGDVIYRAATSPALRGQLSQEAGRCLTRFSSAKERAGKYLTIMKESYETAHPVL